MTQLFHSPSGKKPKPNPISACRVLLLLVAAVCLTAIPHASALLVVQPDTSANRVDSFYWAEPGSEHGNADIPDPSDDGHVTVQLTNSTCWDYRRDPDFEGSGWDSIGPYSALLQYDASNPVCAYAGGWGGPLKYTCGGGGGGGDDQEFTLEVEGEATGNLAIQKQGAPAEGGPFVVCVDGHLVVESAYAGTTTTVPSIWTVNGQADARDDGIDPPETFETFHIPDDFPDDFLDADGKPIPYTYNLKATYKCPASSTTLTATTTVTVFRVFITKPTGDPTDPTEASSENEIIYDMSTPAILTLECEAGDSGHDNNNLCWDTTRINDSWDPPRYPSNDQWGKGLSPTVEWTGLPSSNVLFGEYTVTLWYDTPPYGTGALCSDSTTYEIFYRAHQKNHPGPDSGVTANFFYYYQQTSASCQKAKYDDDLSHAGMTQYDYGDLAIHVLKRVPGHGFEDAIWVGPNATTLNTAGPYDDGPEIDSSFIDSYRVVCAHEMQHYADFTDGYDCFDTDFDSVVDNIEDSNGNGVYDPSDASDFKNAHHYLDQLTVTDKNRLKGSDINYYDDAEWRAHQAELNVPLGSCSDEDWAAMSSSNFDR